MRRACKVLLFLAVIADSASPLGAQDKRALTFVDGVSMPLITDQQLSPDGKQIVFVMDSTDWKANRKTNHLYRIGIDGTGQIQLTFGERGESSPRWSPDGRKIAFLARRDADTTNQIYLLSVEGGEATRLTNHATSPGTIQWAPDGSTIFFLATDALTADERERNRLQDDVYAFEESNVKMRHVWTTDMAGKTKKITDGDYAVTTFQLSNDGKKIAMVRA